MKKEAKKYFSKKIADKGASEFFVDLSTLKELAGFENFVYGGTTTDGDVIIRYCHSSHRSNEQVEAELDWVAYLKERGASVCGPLLSKNKRFIEEIRVNGSSFFVSSFEKAKGSQINITDHQNDTLLFRQWGKATGELHRLSKVYQPSKHITPRYSYMEQTARDICASQIRKEPEIKTITESLVERINGLPQTSSTYMLTHTDLHAGNFFYDNERLWIFDFDDCAYNHVVHDIAMPLYYCTWLFEGTDQELVQFAERFFLHYLVGYLQENPLPEETFQQMPLFLQFRDCDLYGLLNSEWEGEITAKRRRFIDRIRERIVTKQPVVDLDYSKLYRNALFSS